MNRTYSAPYFCAYSRPRLRASATIDDFPTTIDIGISPSECIIDPRLTAKSAWTMVPQGIAIATWGNFGDAEGVAAPTSLDA